MTKHKRFLLLRPPYPYGKPQVYMPTDLMRVAAMIQNVGVDAKVHDLNLHKLPPERELSEYDGFGVGVVGPPYIPISRRVITELRSKLPKSKIFVGGQVISRLGEDHFQRIYGEGIGQVRSNLDLEREIEVNPGSITPAQKIPLRKILEATGDDDLRSYLTREFSTYLSQGCKYNCDFCAADKKQDEMHLEPVVLEDDLREIAKLLRRFGIRTLKTYLSPLDLFQNPTQIAQALELFIRVAKEQNLELELRGLSRVDSFLSAFEEIRELRSLVRSAGITTVGFGVDGTSERIWRSQHKGQKSLSDVDRALDICAELEITPELLMVIGFPIDTIQTLAKTYAYTVARAITHGAVSRPYLAKSFVPGSKAWNGENGVTPLNKKRRGVQSEYKEEIEKLLKDPELFTALDYAAFGSKLTHPDWKNRWVSNVAYAALVLTLDPFGRNTTYPLIPKLGSLGSFSTLCNEIIDAINRLIPFDK